MSLSKRYLNTHTIDQSFRASDLAEVLQNGVPEILFAYILGSVANGAPQGAAQQSAETERHGAQQATDNLVVRIGSDLDLALFLEKGAVGAQEFHVLNKVLDLCEPIVPGVRLDIGFLNTAGIVYRFESLKGRLLFARNLEQWVEFYSITSRAYEHQMVHFEKQRRYRLEAYESKRAKA